MKSVLISIRPQWCEQIASGKKTIEVRKTRPKLETPFKCYIYETQGRYEDMRNCKTFKFWDIRQKVIGEFVCDHMYEINYRCGDTGDWWHETKYEDCDERQMCLSWKEVDFYLMKSNGYGWHISDLKIYDDPKELFGFFRYCTVKDDCHKCTHWDNSYDNTYYEPIDQPFEGCKTSERKHFLRPPQSWCYVEEEQSCL